MVGIIIFLKGFVSLFAMDGVIVNFRGSRRRKRHNQMIVQVDGVDSKAKAENLIGKSVVWTTPSGKELKGKVAKEHGNKGALRIIFETGMPGQSIGQTVVIEY